MKNDNVNPVFKPLLDSISPDFPENGEGRVIPKDVEKELRTIDYLETVMMIPSLSPDEWEKWESIKKQLMRNRGLDIEWEQVEQIEARGEDGWIVEGVSGDGRKYQAIGRYAGDSLEEVDDIEFISLS